MILSFETLALSSNLYFNKLNVQTNKSNHESILTLHQHFVHDPQNQQIQERNDTKKDYKNHPKTQIPISITQ